MRAFLVLLVVLPGIAMAQGPRCLDPGPYFPFATYPTDYLGCTSLDWLNIDCDLTCDGQVGFYCSPYDLDGDEYQDGLPDGAVDDFLTQFDGDFNGICDPKSPLDLVLPAPDGIPDGTSCNVHCQRDGYGEGIDVRGASCFPQPLDRNEDGQADADGAGALGTQLFVPFESANVVRGDLSGLSTPGPGTDLGSVVCLARKSGPGVLDISPDPPVGDGFFFVIGGGLTTPSVPYGLKCGPDRRVQAGNGDCNEAAPCTYSVSPVQQNLDCDQLTGAFHVMGTEDCPWTLETTVPWVHIPPLGNCDQVCVLGYFCEDRPDGTQACFGVGSGAMPYNLETNAGSPRTGLIEFEGRELALLQSGCP